MPNNEKEELTDNNKIDTILQALERKAKQKRIARMKQKCFVRAFYLGV